MPASGRWRSGRIGGLRLVSLMALLLAWEGFVSLAHPAMLPSPMELLQRLQLEWFGGDLVRHLWATVRRLFVSLVIAMSVGVPLGLLMARWRSVDELLDIPMTALLNIPALVVMILAFIWLGLNEWAAITAVVVNKIPTIAVTLREGGRAIDRRYLEIGCAFNLSPLRRLGRIYLPQLYPYLLAALRTGLALVWKIILVVELMGCSEGMGFQLGVFFQYFDIEGILAYSLVFVTLVLLIDGLLIRRWERKVSFWRQCRGGSQ